MRHETGYYSDNNQARDSRFRVLMHEQQKQKFNIDGNSS